MARRRRLLDRALTAGRRTRADAGPFEAHLGDYKRRQFPLARVAVPEILMNGAAVNKARVFGDGHW